VRQALHARFRHENDSRRRTGGDDCVSSRPDSLVCVNRDALLAHGSGSAGHVRELSFSDTSHQGITQLALDALPGGSADDELAGLMPTIFERVDALGIYTFDADRRAGQLRPLRAA
jgi:hypothetical protein